VSDVGILVLHAFSALFAEHTVMRVGCEVNSVKNFQMRKPLSKMRGEGNRVSGFQLDGHGSLLVSRCAVVLHVA
jgi:hypothetical protein